MGIIDKKRDINAKLAAVNALDDSPKSDYNSSNGTTDNDLNSTNFLIELTTSLVGLKWIKDYVVDTITHRLPEIEVAIKDGLKRELKELVSCNVNPSLPTWFQHGGDGVELKVSDIDFYDIMKTDPTSFAGGLTYTDVPAKLTSKDFDTYLYYTIQQKPILGVPVTTNWIHLGVNMLESTFFESTVATTTKPSRNNIIKYTASPAYSNKTVPEFNNDMIDSFSLFGNPFSLDSPKVITIIMEQLFGSTSSSSGGGVGKSKKQIEKELEFQEVLDCILNSQDSNITDNFFTFDNPTLARIDRESNNRRNGIREVETCGNLEIQVNLTNVAAEISSLLTGTTTTTTKADEANEVATALDNLATLQAEFAPITTDRETIRNNFFIEIIRKLQGVIMSSIITPEFMSLFAINHQIVYGKGSSYNGPLDFMRKNRDLIWNISKVIANILLSLLLNIALLYLSEKLKEKFANDKIEKAKNYVSILLSYTGVPPGVIAQIRKINTPGIPSTKLKLF